MKTNRPFLLTALLLFAFLLPAAGQSRHPTHFKHLSRSMKASWYGGEEALRVADSVLAYQYPCGGWAKNHDWHVEESESKMQERAKILLQIANGESLGATIDNGATTHELLLLSKVYAAVGASTDAADQAKATARRCREAYVRGLDYLLEAQYDNGGWPQFYPLKPLDNEGHPFYSNHITFNDDAMCNVLLMLRDIYEQRQPYGSMHLEPELLQRVRQAFDRGIECILDCQIRKD